MIRIVTLTYAAVAYGAFLATFLYAIGFLGNVVVPKSIDSAATDPWPIALAVDLVLLSCFAVQHSVMARQGFKRRLARFIPEAAERSTYVLASSVLLLFLFWQWRPLGGIVWEVRNEVARAVLFAGFAFGWVLVLVTTFVIDHFDLFGLRQAWRAFRGERPAPLRFATPILYRIVRHPLYVGWLFAFWSTPTMTVTHLLFAVVTTAYIVAAIPLEERDLMRAHPEYAAYRRRVPMLVPAWPQSATATDPARTARAESRVSHVQEGV
jgi:methanethiol S-methyltransferase